MLPKPLIALLVTVALLVAACAPRKGSPAPAPDVLLLVVDGLRADEADAFVESASLEEWLGGDAVRYRRAYAPSSLGAQSLAALFAGRMPTHGGGIGWAEAQPSERADTLATVFRRAGYRTGFVSQASWASRPGFARGFDDLQGAPVEGWPAEEVAERALRVIDDWRTLDAREVADAPRPSFLVVHWAPAGVESGDPELAAGLDAARFATASALADLKRGLDERAALTEAVVALIAGHGVERGEHGGTGTGWTLHEEVVRVPLVVRGLATGPGEVDAPVSTLALGASLRALAGDSPEETSPGPFAPAPLPTVGAPVSKPVLVELVVRERAIARAVIDGDLKSLSILREVPVADRRAVARGYEELQAAMASGAIPLPPLFGDPVRELLVRVGAAGLDETELALEEHRQDVSRLRALLRDYRRLCEDDGWAPPEITERLPVDAEDAAQLEMLGYL